MNPLTCTRCETEIPNSAFRFQGQPFHFACSPMFELLIELRLDFNSLRARHPRFSWIAFTT
jgi:hypothetical protein